MKKELMRLTVLFSFVLFCVQTHAAVINVPADHPTIAAAIAAASSGDTIDVAAGTYMENVVIDKQLILQGAGSASTTLDASGGSIGILLQSGGTVGQRLIIRDMEITGATLDGIRAEKAGGLNLAFVTFESLLITANGAKGIEIHNNTTVSEVEVIDCVLSGNTQQGLRTASNVIINSLDILGSNLNGNSYGLYLQGTVDNVSIMDSTFNGNSVWGAYLSETGPISNLLIEGSSFDSNVGGFGIVFFTASVLGIDGVIISGSTFDNNSNGIWFGANVVQNISIESCDIVNDSASGVDGIEFSFGDLTDVWVTQCNIVGNTLGVNNAANGIVDAPCNWWGAMDGPSGFGPGSGDAITDFVDVPSWLLGPAPGGECVSELQFLLLELCGDAKNHGQFVSCVAKTTKGWVKDGLITSQERSELIQWAAQSDFP